MWTLEEITEEVHKINPDLAKSDIETVLEVLHSSFLLLDKRVRTKDGRFWSSIGQIPVKPRKYRNLGDIRTVYGRMRQMG